MTGHFKLKNKINLFSLIICFLLVSACSGSNELNKETKVITTEKTKAVSNEQHKPPVTARNISAEEKALITKAKKVTAEYNLSTIKQNCLTYEVQTTLFEGKHIIDVREIHSDLCGGDANTNPRLFTIAIEKTTGILWSDAKSMLGQLEKLDQ